MDGSGIGDFHADEIFNNIRGMVTTGNKIRIEAPTIRNNPTGHARRGRPSPMIDAIGGTSIHYHAQPAVETVGLQDGQRDDEKALWQGLPSRGLDGGGLAHRLRRSGAVLRHGGI